MTLSVIMTLSLIKCLNTQEYAQLWSEAQCNGADDYDGWINDRMQCAGFKWILRVRKVKILFGDFAGKAFVISFFFQISLQGLELFCSAIKL